ncbi:ATP-binding protein, partial [Crocinitomicaceae bacterium]|nr:ATP-binding protein [Crocinitomicaceae bacterium]
NLNQKQTNELLTKAIDENSRLEQMIDNILNASRLENKVLDPTKEDVDFNLLSNQIKKRFGALSSVAEIKLEIDKDLRLFADQQMISSILSNLVENALKYARNDHPIVIYGHSAPNNAATFGVKDLGPGIPKELKQDVFKKFYRLENEETRSQKGTGLGLYIVSQLVEIQGGTIRCIDNEPNGVNFEIQMNHAE